MICNIFSQWLKWPEKEQNLLTLCGLLHDIGKLKIPDSIIKKPDRLTDEEYKKVKDNLETYTYTFEPDVLNDNPYTNPIVNNIKEYYIEWGLMI